MATKERSIQAKNGMLWSSLKREKVENPHNVYGWGVIGDIDGESYFVVYPTKEAAADHVSWLWEAHEIVCSAVPLRWSPKEAPITATGQEVLFTS